MSVLRLAIDTKSLYFNIKNDNQTGHTATVATPLKQGSAIRPELYMLSQIPESIEPTNRENLISQILSGSRALAKINGIYVFDKVAVNGYLLEGVPSYCIYVREETDCANVHFGRQKMHYPLSLVYEDLDTHIDNKSVITAVSKHLNNYAFIIEAFEYNTESRVLNFDATIVGSNLVPYSKVFVNRRGVGNKFSKMLVGESDSYDTEIIALRQNLGFNNVFPDNYGEIVANNYIEMQLRDKKPIDFGLMIKECPDTLDTTLLITSRNKMHGTQVFERSLNYSGVYADTSKMPKSAALNRRNIEAFTRFCKNVEFSWLGKDGSSAMHRYYMAQNVSQHYIAQLFRDISVPIENKKFNTEGLAEYVEESDKFKYWDVVIASGSAKDREPFMDVRPVERSFHMKSENDLIRIGGANNRVLDPGLLNAGLWYKEGEVLSAKEYLKRRATPILIVFPIDLKTDDSNSDQLSPEVIAENEWKRKVKAGFGDDVLLAFAYAFPDTETKVMVKYRANAVMIEQLTAGIETDDEDEGVDDTDD